MKIKYIYSILVRQYSAKFWGLTFLFKENLSCVEAMLQIRLYCSNKNCKENSPAKVSITVFIHSLHTLCLSG